MILSKSIEGGIMKLVVLGGGLAGLYSAFTLRTLGHKGSITIVEASSRLGGWINSHKTEDGRIYELGPRTIRCNEKGMATLKLIESIGLEKKIVGIGPTHPAYTDRKIKVNGRLHKIPTTLSSLFKTQQPFSQPLIKSLLKDIFPKTFHSDDDTLHSFAERRFGPEVAQYLVDPLVRGVFAGSSRNISVQSLIPDALHLEKKYKSFIIGSIMESFGKKKSLYSGLNQVAQNNNWKLWTLDGGLGTMIDALALKLEQMDVNIIVDAKCTGISNALISTTKGDIQADHVVSSLPANRLAPLVSNEKISSLLNQIPFVSVGVVNLEFKGCVVNEPSFGYLIPSSEPSKTLGVIFDTCVKPQGDNTIFTVMMGGFWFNEHFGENPSKEDLLREAINEITKTLQIKSDPINYNISIHRNCIPQYTLGHACRIQDILKLIEANNLPMTIVGNSYFGVGINDVIDSVNKSLIKLELR